MKARASGPPHRRRSGHLPDAAKLTAAREKEYVMAFAGLVARMKQAEMNDELTPLQTLESVGGVSIRRFEPLHGQPVLELILAIQREEFDIPITAKDQPDLQDIPSFYQTGTGDFWVAAAGDRIVGTIGLKDIENNSAALRKMFVARSWRGPSLRIAATLLDQALIHARQAQIRNIYLGTTDKFAAAHRFYEKNGFVLIDRHALPPTFPLMVVDTRFYALRLA